MHHLPRLTFLLALLLIPVARLVAEDPRPAPAPTAAAHLVIDATKPAVPVSPTLYGVFFEEINRSGDGGLYAEMLQNRSFEDSATEPLGWKLVAEGGAQAAMSLDRSHPLNPENPTALRLEIRWAEGTAARAGIANLGFKGVPEIPRDKPEMWLPAFERAQGQPGNGLNVVRGKTYQFSLYARTGNDPSGPLTVTLINSAGRLLASQVIAGVGTDWKKFDGALAPADTDTDARLVITAAQPGVWYLDMVSLFLADTFKGRPNGLRPDLAQRVADLKPAFVRFPGGCFVEGDKLQDAFRWKKTVGDVAARPGHWNLWGYRSNDGLGYLEYLQFCEDIGAEPLYVFNVGMAHKDHVEMDKMDEWVRDTLDAIEYANGPAESRWGSQRARDGHPAPFHLKYLEVGNENGGAIYNERYALFYDAIHARYPEITMIADEWSGLPKSRPVQRFDAHYYGDPEGVRVRATKYDGYDRRGPQVYFGEYAVTRNAGTGNLQAAVAEAAFMTGLERNSDVVRMASYAPLFVNPSWRSWNPNAIVFDGARSYGTPSYYVQKMFADNRPDEVLAADLRQTTAVPPVRRGMMGVGTWGTQAEYRDLKITRLGSGEVLFDGDKVPASDWKTARGHWEFDAGALRQTGDETDVRALTADAVWDDCVFSLKARKLGGKEGFLVIFRSAAGKDRNWWNIGGWGNTGIGLEGGGLPEGQAPFQVETGRWYDLRVELKGASVKCYLDGKLMHDAIRTGDPALYATAGRDRATGEWIVKAVNASDEPQALDLELKGAGVVRPAARKIVLTSAGATDENSFDAPERIVPVAGTIDGASSSFRQTLAPDSVTILRLQADGR